ncbi:conserved hypothetical protein [Rhodospirillaceae bacterium LM-1]|nr:conserved hypothetical protein [Rhodospirillaceae bacterium LM-1]
MPIGSAIPLWRKAAQTIRQWIVDGNYGPSEKLPTEAKMAQLLGVHRHTVRRAIAQLNGEGLLSVEQGRGIFVQEWVINYRVSKRTRFSKNVAAEQRHPGGTLVAAREIKAEGAVMKALALRKGTPVLVLDILNEADGRPISISSHHFPKARVPGLFEAYRKTGSITKALALSGIADYTRKSTSVSARPARSADAKQLQQSPNRPILLAESVNADMEGRPVLYSVSRWASDRVQLVFEPGNS